MTLDSKITKITENFSPDRFDEEQTEFVALVTIAGDFKVDCKSIFPKLPVTLVLAQFFDILVWFDKKLA